MIELIQVPFSHYCAKVKIALREKGLSYLSQPVPGGWMDKPEFQAVNPLCRIPFLIDGDIRIGESQVINEYLEERYPQPALMPETAAQRAEVRWLCNLHDLYTAPQIFRIFFGLVNGQDKAGFAKEWQQVEQSLALLEQRVAGPWLAGEHFTLADCAWVLSWMHANALAGMLAVPFDAEARYPRISAWYQRALGRASVSAVVEEAKAALAAM